MMNRSLTPNMMPAFALLISSGLLVGAWIFQYGFGYVPCQMCYWQRHAHKLVIGLAILGLILHYVGKPDVRYLNALLVLALLFSAGLGLWHMGVEFKWWEGPKTCLSGDVDLDAIGSGKDLLDSLKDPVKPPACSEAAWHFLGLSMAGWNMVISGLSAALIAGFGFKRREGET